MKEVLKRHTFLPLLLPSALILLTAAGLYLSRREVRRDFFAMDTVMNIRAFGFQAEAASAEAEAEVHRLDHLLSVGEESSEISLLNRDGRCPVSPETLRMIRRSLEIWEETDGAFDITLLPLSRLWGFTDRNYRVPSGEEVQSLAGSRMDTIRVAEDGSVSFSEEGTEIDLGGIAKGYTSDRIMELFRAQGIRHALVSLGGNVQTLGTRPDGRLWKIGIEDPSGEGLLGVLSLKDVAVITSGGYERYFEKNGKRYHHILDPASGMPAESGLVSVTIVCQDGMTADALSTALFVMGRERAASFWRSGREAFEMILQDSDGTLWITEGIADSFTPDETCRVEILRADP